MFYRTLFFFVAAIASSGADLFVRMHFSMLSGRRPELLETFVHIVVGDMDSLRFFSLSASISYFFDHETLWTLLGFKTSVTILQAVVIINERSLIHNRTLDGNRCEKKKVKNSSNTF